MCILHLLNVIIITAVAVTAAIMYRINLTWMFKIHLHFQAAHYFIKSCCSMFHQVQSIVTAGLTQALSNCLTDLVNPRSHLEWSQSHQGKAMMVLVLQCGLMCEEKWPETVMIQVSHLLSYHLQLPVISSTETTTKHQVYQCAGGTLRSYNIMSSLQFYFSFLVSFWRNSRLFCFINYTTLQYTRLL